MLPHASPLPRQPLSRQGTRFPALAPHTLVRLQSILLWLNLAGFILMALLRNINTYDESVSLTMARGILDGMTPYVDLWDTKPPATYYALAAVMRFFGRAWWVPRFLMVFGLSVILLLMPLLRKRVSLGTTVWATGLLVVGLMAKGGYRIDTYMLAGAFIVLGVVLVYGGRYATYKSYAVFGFFAGIATTFNQIGLLYFAGFLLAANLRHLAPQFPYPTLTSALTAFKKSCLAIIAYLIPLAAMFFFLTRIGASSAFIEAAYAQPSRLTQTVMDAPWQTKLFVVQLLGAPVHLVTLALLGTWLASLLLAHRGQAHRPAVSGGIGTAGGTVATGRLAQMARHPDLLIVSLALFGMISPIMRYGNPHWIPSTFFFAFLCGLLLEGIERNLKAPFTRLLRPAALLGLIGVSTIAWWGGPLRFIQETPLYEDLQQGQEAWRALGECLEPSDAMLAISATSPRLYYLLQRYPPWKYLYVDESNYGTVSWRHDVVAMLDKFPPKAVALEVHRNRDRILEQGPGPLALADEYVTYESLRGMLEKNYRRIPLAYAQDAMHGAALELYVRRDLACQRTPPPYPLSPG